MARHRLHGIGITLLAALAAAAGLTAAGAEDQADQGAPRMNVVLLDDGAVGLPRGVECRRNDWDAWRRRLPTFLDRLRLVADLGRASGESPTSAGSLYALEIPGETPPDGKELRIASELERIAAGTRRPSVVLARSSSGRDQLRLAVVDDRDHPPLDAAKTVRILAEISPAVAHRPIAESFGPFVAPPTLIFDPRFGAGPSDPAVADAAKWRWGVLEETYLLPHYVLHLLAALRGELALRPGRFLATGVPKVGASLFGKKDALVVYTGVDSCLPSSDPRFRYRWEPVAEQFAKSYQETGKGTCAKPFVVMASEKTNAARLRERLDAYQREAEASGKTPLIVMVPNATLGDYLTTLLPDKTLPSVLQAEARVAKDIAWTKACSPTVLQDLKQDGYSIHVGAFSFGGRMGTDGIAETGRLYGSNDPLVADLTVINARVLNSDLDALGTNGLVAQTRRITTEGDAWASPYSAAYGKDNRSGIRVLDVDHPAWRQAGALSQEVRHNIPFTLPSATEITVDAGGVRMRSTVADLLANTIPLTKTERALNDERALTQQFRGAAQSDRPEVGGILFAQGNTYLVDRTGRVRQLGERAAAAIRSSGEMGASFTEGGQDMRAVRVPLGEGRPPVPLAARADDVLLARVDLAGGPQGPLPFGLPRFWQRQAPPGSSARSWSDEPLTVDGLDRLTGAAAGPGRTEVRITPAETGSHAAYWVESGAGGGPAPVFRKKGGDLLPDLVACAGGGFAWRLRHGVQIELDQAGRVTALRGPDGKAVGYLREQGRLVGQQDASGRVIRRGGEDRPADPQPGAATCEFRGGRLSRMRVDGGGEPVEWRFRPDGLVLGAVRGETAILWSRGADRRILQTAVGSLRIAGDAAEFLPAIVIGRGG